MDRIIIGTKNPNDITPQEAEEFAKILRSSIPKLAVQIQSSEYSGKAVTLYEILNIWLLTKVSEQLVEQVVKLAIEWVRLRFSKPHKRTTSIAIYDARGEIIKRVVIKNATSEPEYGVEEYEKKYLIKPPSDSELTHCSWWKRLFR